MLLQKIRIWDVGVSGTQTPETLNSDQNKDCRLYEITYLTLTGWTIETV